MVIEDAPRMLDERNYIVYRWELIPNTKTAGSRVESRGGEVRRNTSGELSGGANVPQREPNATRQYHHRRSTIVPMFDLAVTLTQTRQQVFKNNADAHSSLSNMECNILT